jgi:hypothetical protein
MNSPEDFAAFVAALPREYEIALMADNVSTAFYRALRAGWTTDQLIGDAHSTLARGGVGLVVTRMNGFAERGPIKRSAQVAIRNQQVMPLPECSECGQPYSRASRVTLGTECVSCGKPLILRQHIGGE